MCTACTRKCERIWEHIQNYFSMSKTNIKCCCTFYSTKVMGQWWCNFAWHHMVSGQPCPVLARHRFFILLKSSVPRIDWPPWYCTLCVGEGPILRTSVISYHSYAEWYPSEARRLCGRGLEFLEGCKEGSLDNWKLVGFWWHIGGNRWK